jgi:DHA2 family multidrug resistance protein
MPGKPQSSAWKPSANPWLIAISVMLATFMEVMDTSIAAVAVPYIAGSVSSTNDEAEWVLTVYLVANAVFLPSSTWFSQRFGRKKFLMFSILIFTIASFGCGIADSLGFILVARAIQGAGGGALQPLALAILIESFPPAKRGQALALYALGVVVAPILGPVLGGYLTDTISWRWAFYINIPVGILALLMQGKFLEDPPWISGANPGPLDRVGLMFLGIWTGCLQFICDKGQEDDWFGSNNIRWAAVIGTVGFIGFLLREFEVEKPLVNLRAFCNRNLRYGSILVFLLGAGIYGITTVLPLFFQTLMGYNAFAAGLAVAPRGLGSIVSAIAVGALAAKVDARLLVAAGFTTFAISNFWTSSFTLDISPTSLFWPIAVSGLAISMVFVPLSNLTLATLSQGGVGNGSGIFNLLRNIGGSIGISAANTIAQRHLQTHRNDIVRNLSGASPVLRRQLHALTVTMSHHAGPAKASLRAFALTQRSLDSQAQIYAYVDVFRYFALLFALCVPVVYLMQGAKGGSGEGAG